MFTRYITRHLSSQTNRKMETKPRWDIHFIPLRVVITKKIKEVASVSKVYWRGKPYTMLENINCQELCGKQVGVPQTN